MNGTMTWKSLTHWSQYDHFCHEYQKDKVATMPAPAVPIGYKQPMDSITGWDEGT
jgi:hypothetical protein